MNGGQNQQKSQELAQVKTAGLHTGTDPDERKKKCSKCGIEKQLSEFFRQKPGKYGRAAKCKKCTRFYELEYRSKNREKINSIQRKYRINNLSTVNHYYRERYSLDEQFRIKTNLRNRVRDTLSPSIKTESQETIKLFGCSLDYLRRHLELLFKKGMSWDNYGANGWNIDHIKPITLFDLTQTEQQKQCYHYTNLQPLWPIDNMKKGAKYG